MAFPHTLDKVHQDEVPELNGRPIFLLAQSVNVPGLTKRRLQCPRPGGLGPSQEELARP